MAALSTPYIHSHVHNWKRDHFLCPNNIMLNSLSEKKESLYTRKVSVLCLSLCAAVLHPSRTDLSSKWKHLIAAVKSPQVIEFDEFAEEGKPFHITSIRREKRRFFFVFNLFPLFLKIGPVWINPSSIV